MELWFRRFDDGTFKIPYTVKELKESKNISIPENGLTEAQMNEHGVFKATVINPVTTLLSAIYTVEYTDPVQNEDGVWETSPTVVERPVDDVYDNEGNLIVTAEERKFNLHKAFLTSYTWHYFKDKLESTPRVDTGLGFEVDGGRNNKDDFKSKWDVMNDTDTTTVRDADNVFHEGITKDQMETIWKAIVANGEAVLQKKWATEIQIENATTLEELKAVTWDS